MHKLIDLRGARMVACCAVAVLGLLAVGTDDSSAGVTATLAELQQSGKIDAAKAASARKSYLAARSLRHRVTGTRRTPITNQLRLIESLSRKGRISGGRVTPLFTQLQVNVDWFRTKGPAAVGTRSRIGGGRIYYQYFAGWGWQFHPLANFSRLNAIWTDSSAKARRALGSYAHELIAFGAVRGGALTWEYYFPFAGSRAPFISSISQGTAIQSLARAGKALGDAEITAAAARGAKAFDVPAPTGLKIERDGGLHFLGYSGNRRAIIFNMFAQALDGLHDYAKITGDDAALELFRQGVVAARVELPQSDTGAWSYYELGGSESNLNYHQVLVEFMDRLCGDTGNEAVFCELHDRLESYLKAPPVLTGIEKKPRRGRIYVSFTLSKISTVTVRSADGSTVVATVAHGKRVFSLRKIRSTAVTITVRDLAGNTAQYSK